jgi:hypothetical protein
MIHWWSGPQNLAELLSLRAVHTGIGGQDETGKQMGDNKHIVQPKPPAQAQAHCKVCTQAVGQPIQDGGIDSRADVNSTVLPMMSSSIGGKRYLTSL